MCPSPRPESFATRARGRGQRREHERHAVGDPAGGVLVDVRAADVAELDGVAGRDHRARHRQRLARLDAAAARRPSGTPPPARRHARPPRTSATNRSISSGSDVAAVPLGAIDRRAGPSVTLAEPRASPSEAPSTQLAALRRRAARRPWRRGRRTSSRVPISCGPPGSPAASSGVRSREWSVGGVVGSQPWSPVMSSTPPSSAATAPGSRRSNASIAAAYPAGSLRWPYFESKSTRFVNTSGDPAARAPRS